MHKILSNLNKDFIIATRESPLALWQANYVKMKLTKLYPDLNIQLLGMTTTADQHLDYNLAKIGGKGLFVKELEEALLTKRAHVAVHSMKDVPAVLPSGLMINVIIEREDPRDVFVSNCYASLAHLKEHAIIGTSSLRRQTQLQSLYPAFNCQAIRGNIQTRLKRLDSGEFDALILAAAGLKRLNLTDRIRVYLEPEVMLPAAGQGALGLECRAEDELTQALIAPLHHLSTAACLTAERAVCKKLNGGCQAPIAAFAQEENNHLYLRALVGNPNSGEIIRAEQRASSNGAETLGISVAETLLDLGAAAILKSLVL